MTKIFKLCDNATHNIRSGQILERKNNRTNNSGVESISTFGAKVCDLAPENLRKSMTLNSFNKDVSSKTLKNGIRVTFFIDCVKMRVLFN